MLYNSSADFTHGESHVTTGDPKMHFADVFKAADETPLRRDVDDELGGRRCASCSVRQVALGAIVAGHLYNERRSSSSGSNNINNHEAVSTGNCRSEHRQSLYL